MILGASRWEATRGVVQRSITAALNPTLQHMSVIGLVTIPSFMGGQLLGGIAPVQVWHPTCRASVDLHWKSPASQTEASFTACPIVHEAIMSIVLVPSGWSLHNWR